jgi:hypothetical protein
MKQTNLERVLCGRCEGMAASRLLKNTPDMCAAVRNIGLRPVRPADMLSAVRSFSGLQTRWEHRLKVYVPAVLLSAIVTTAMAQPRAAVDFQLQKITTNFISSPQFAYAGAEQFQADQRERWLEVEVTFASAPEFTDELTLKYFILFNGKLLTGEVTHVNIAAARDNRSVMYVTPKTLQRLILGRTITNNAIQNVAVQLMQQGALKDEMSLNRGAPQWYATMPQVGGLVLNKNETPFMPLYWDRYCQIKTSR